MAQSVRRIGNYSIGRRDLRPWHRLPPQTFSGVPTNSPPVSCSHCITWAILLFGAVLLSIPTIICYERTYAQPYLQTDGSAAEPLQLASQEQWRLPMAGRLPAPRW